ncbi:hypothetical protein [Undibacterium sp. TS12]|uniref:hypothetical protein n=1 Tax=Undibacterium sp. TS12 TaxID=2908202 RepID=UPI001F4CBBEE|nr:hypothetical protein [Undibacterium sp. TS12]MCH8621743.1 hypothetical protein [Undibacterium sp. TS12]
MLKFFCDSLQVDVSDQQIQVCRQTKKIGSAKSPESVSIFPIDSESDVSTFCAQWQQAISGLEKPANLLDISLDDTMVRYFMVAPPPHARSFKDLHAAATMRLEALFGVASEDWQVTADWQMHANSLACGIPKILLSKISKAAKQSGQHILSLQPRFIRAWNACQKKISPDTWFASVGKEVMTLALQKGGQIKSVKTIALPVTNDETWLLEQLHRESMLQQLDMPSELLLSGDVPAAWLCKLIQKNAYGQLAMKSLAGKSVDQPECKQKAEIV